MVIQQNRESISKRSYGMLELMFGESGLDVVGGMDGIIQYFINVINALKNWETKAVPMGILMVGAPGTGKTNLIQALSRDMGIHFVQLRCLRDIDPKTRGDWDLYRAFDIIRSFTPVIVFIDDIDKIVYTNTDENERRILNQLFEDLIKFMGDPAHRGKILWIAASNRPDQIHPEFRKRGRLDDVVPFVIPNNTEREDILKKVISRNAIPYNAEINFSAIAQRTERCSGGDLETILMRGFQNARLDNRDIVEERDLVKASDEFVHASTPIMDEYLTLLAVREASLSTLVPKQLYGNLQERIYENNKISKIKIEQRLRELDSQIRITYRR